MPNKPRDDNPGRVIRIENALWAKVRTMAAERKVTASVIVREAIERYVGKP